MSAGGAFNVWAPGNHKALGNKDAWDRCRVWNFAVPGGETLDYGWNRTDFENGVFFLRVYGPNGFFREFWSDERPPIIVRGETHGDFDLLLVLKNPSGESRTIEILDNAYGARVQTKNLSPDEECRLAFGTQATSGWYDVTVRETNHPTFYARFAGHIENGKESLSDPLIGNRA